MFKIFKKFKKQNPCEVVGYIAYYWSETSFRREKLVLSYEEGQIEENRRKLNRADKLFHLHRSGKVSKLWDFKPEWVTDVE